MEIIVHRLNKAHLLKDTPQKYGVEVDIRTFNKDLIINHDPFLKGELFKDWIKNYRHGTLILNLKEEGLEKEILFLLNQYSIKSYFFLDQSFPSLIKNISKFKYSIRVSDYESIQTALNLKDMVEWIWLDTFHNLSLTNELITDLKRNNFKVCLASPELNNTSKVSIEFIKKFINNYQINLDAVCTKYPILWK